MTSLFKIGTRNSPLAMIQANMVKTALEKAHPDLTVEIMPIRSKADWDKSGGEVPLSEEAGGKGMFATEIETMIKTGIVDCGVHSLKDMATDLPAGLVLHHVLPRADVRDGFISATATCLEDLPENAVIGTCSPRRAALALSYRSDLQIVAFRGNVETRLNKVKSGQVDATFLAMAGLQRLDITDDIIHPMTVDKFLPACGQGAICIEARDADFTTQALLDSVHCQTTYLCVVAEREVLRILDGSCHTPIAAYARKEGKNIMLKGMVLSLDGKVSYTEERESPCDSIDEAIAVGKDVGRTLKQTVPKNILVA